jgi:hypothetical protein
MHELGTIADRHMQWNSGRSTKPVRIETRPVAMFSNKLTFLDWIGEAKNGKPENVVVVMNGTL